MCLVIFLSVGLGASRHEGFCGIGVFPVLYHLFTQVIIIDTSFNGIVFHVHVGRIVGGDGCCGSIVSGGSIVLGGEGSFVGGVFLASWVWGIGGRCGCASVAGVYATTSAILKQMLV